MNRFNKGFTYVIKPCAVGYGVYNEPYWFEGRRYEGLHMTAKTKEECIKAVESDEASYILQEE